MAIKLKITGGKEVVKQLHDDLNREAVRAGRFRRVIARKALGMIAKITPVWSGETQSSIRLSEGRPIFASGVQGLGEEGTNFMPVGVEAEMNSNISRVTDQIYNLKRITSFTDPFPNFYITVNSEAADLGLFEGKIPYNPKHNLYPRVSRDAMEEIVAVLRNYSL